MATLRANHVAISDTLAHFKDWAKSISDAFAAFGWVKAGDSGQVDWATIVSPPGAGLYVYEIWHANDSWQATMPLFVKVEYGNTATPATPAIAITIGTGSDGSGNLTNAITRQLQSLTASSSTAWDCLYSGDAGRIVFVLWRNINSCNGPYLCCIERSKDGSGNDSGDFIYAQTGTYGTANYKAQGVTSANWIGIYRAAVESHVNVDNPSSLGGYCGVYPMQPVFGYARNPLLGVLHGVTNDWVELDQVSLQVYGTSHVYVVVGKSFLYLSNANYVVLMRYD